ncbi:MAG: OmpA family protein [Planctomycetota bacterium]|nr:MAG: OmpA family protein [Planctomycetota bacterium]
MSKLSFAVVAAVTALSSVGCSSAWMTREEHERETAQLTEYKNALEAENASLRAKGAEFDRMKAELETNSESAKFYNDLAASLKKALNGLGVSHEEVTITPDGRAIFSTDVLFDLASWTLTPRGKEILAKFAQTQKTTVMKIVGHTDSKRVVSTKLKTALDTDTNKELSVKRAIAVMGELLNGGVRESQIVSVEGHGSSEPKKTDKESRRVEIFIIPGAQVQPTSFKKPVKK